MIYAFTSASNNNGSAFGGLTGQHAVVQHHARPVHADRSVPPDGAGAGHRRLPGPQAAGAAVGRDVPHRHARSSPASSPAWWSSWSASPTSPSSPSARWSSTSPAGSKVPLPIDTAILTRPAPAAGGASPGGRPNRRTRSMFDPAILRRAVADSFVKLDPRLMARNPVMFVVEIGSVLTTLLFLRDLRTATAADNVFAGLVSAWLWFTVLFANFAEAVAEGRGKAQADTLRKTRSETVAFVRRAGRLAPGDAVQPAAGRRLLRGRGGADHPRRRRDHRRASPRSTSRPSPASLRRSSGSRAATAARSPAAPRCSPTASWCRISSKPGESFLDRMIALVEGAARQKTPERDRPQHPPGRAHHHLPAGNRDAAAVRHLLQRRAVDHGAHRPPRLPHPHDHRRPAVGHRHRRHGPAGAAQRAGDVGPGGRGRGRLQHAAARQDRHDHARESTGGRVPPPPRGGGTAPGRNGAALQPGRRDSRGSLDRGAGQGTVRCPRAGTDRSGARTLHRPDPHERPRSRRLPRPQRGPPTR